MRDSDNTTNCRFADDVVSYIYDEMSPVAREEFDAHLLDCAGCIEELAAVSLSHYSVLEWRQVEFEPLATPVFELPQQETAIDRVRAFLASVRWITAAGALATAMILVFGGIFMLTEQSGSDEFAAIANDNKNTVTKPNVTPAVTNARRDGEPNAVNQTSASNPASKATNERTDIEKREQPAQPRAVKASVPANAAKNNDRRREQNRVIPASNPRLNDFEEDEDDSLRLGDIFDEIDTLD